jgi:hypothetical protein
MKMEAAHSPETVSNIYQSTRSYTEHVGAVALGEVFRSNISRTFLSPSGQIPGQYHD